MAGTPDLAGDDHSPVAPGGRTGLPEAIVVPAILVVLLSLLIWTDWLWDLDQQVYDWQIQISQREPPRDIVIVAIDEQSLTALGRWPWSRSVHADLVRRINDAGARVIGLDVLFAEADRSDPAGDARLAAAMADSGKVVLPVANEQQRLGGPLVELLPLTELTSAAARLGHVDRQLDQDAIARTAYLMAGLGTPRWPSFALAMLQIGMAESAPPPTGLRNPGRGSSPMAWLRDYQIWVPYAGPPGHFPRVSAIDVLREAVSPDHFHDAYVLIGATAAGLGDLLPTPVSGDRHPMPGVEVVANELDTIRQGLAILPVPTALRWVLSVLLVIAPALLYPMAPRWSLYIWAGFLAASILLSFSLLRGGASWFPPAAVLAVQVLSYPLWSWRRLVQTLRYLNEALRRLHAEPAMTDRGAPADLAESMEFLQHVLPIRGAALLGPDGGLQAQWGQAPAPVPTRTPPPGQWDIKPPAVWTGVRMPAGPACLGFALAEETRPDQSLLTRLEPVVHNLEGPRTEPAGSPIELMQLRIEQVSAATERLRIMRQFIGETLRHMAHGVLVADVLGTIVLANERAAKYLGESDSNGLIGQGVLASLERLQLRGEVSSIEAVRRAWNHQGSSQLAALSPAGDDLLVQVSTFIHAREAHSGVVVSLADVTDLKNSERRRRELMAFLSHDLRSPLSSILAVTGVAKLRPERVQQAQFIDRIEGHARKTLDLADAFLELSRAQTADWREFKAVDLAAVAHGAIDAVADQAAAKGINLRRRLPDAAPMRGDHALLERALVNLLGNAIKYSPQGRHVEMEVVFADDHVSCSVTDNGHGIPADALPSLFQKYHRVSAPEHAAERGSGLGLAFVQAVAERHRGQVTVASEPGRGSRFTLLFPLTK